MCHRSCGRVGVASASPLLTLASSDRAGPPRSGCGDAREAQVRHVRIHHLLSEPAIAVLRVRQHAIQHRTLLLGQGPVERWNGRRAIREQTGSIHTIPRSSLGLGPVIARPRGPEVVQDAARGLTSLPDGSGNQHCPAATPDRGNRKPELGSPPSRGYIRSRLSTPARAELTTNTTVWESRLGGHRARSITSRHCGRSEHSPWIFGAHS